MRKLPPAYRVDKAPKKLAQTSSYGVNQFQGDLSFFMRNAWRKLCNKPEIEYNSSIYTSLNTLKKSEWCELFERYMRNRLLVGRFRYGKFWDKDTNKYDRISSCIQRLQHWKETGNDENLVDVANLCMKEFAIGEHPNKHFNAIDDGKHTQLKKGK